MTVETKSFKVYFDTNPERTPHDEETYFKHALKFLEKLVNAKDWLEVLNEALWVEINAEDEKARIQLVWGGPGLDIELRYNRFGRFIVKAIYYDWHYSNDAEIIFKDQEAKEKLETILDELIELRTIELIEEWSKGGQR